MATHTHLDRQRRQRGECPACDLAWDHQEARLKRGAPALRTIKQLERMNGPPLAAKFCPATETARRRDPHLCGKLAGHEPPHHCPLCEKDWL